MFNHGTRGRRSGDGTGITGLATSYIEARSPAVTISGYQITGSSDRALDPAGGQTIVVGGGGFATGMTGTLGGVAISGLTYISPTQVSFTSPAKTGGLYVLVLSNTNGNTGALVPGVVYSSVPTFTTAAGPVGTVYETASYSKTIVATSDSAVTYALTSGSFPPDATFNTTTGVLTGTVPTIASGSTTYPFTITATDSESQSVTRSFTITESTDVLSWVYPSNGATVTLDGTPYSQALSATAGSGSSVTYTADTLPTGLTLTAGTISGTPSIEGTTSTTLTATATSTTRTQTNNISWVISLGDSFWKYNSIVLSANASVQTQSFVADNSINNSQLILAGDTRAQNFNPYQPGFYSVQLNGTVNDYVSIPHNTGLSIMSGSTNTFVAECFVFWTNVLANQTIMDKSGRNSVSFENWSIALNANKYFQLVWGASGSPGTSGLGILTSTTIPLAGQWYHVAFVKSNADWALFVNGTRLVSFNGLNTANDANPAALRIGLGIGSEANSAYFSGYVSNVRVYNGVAGSAPYAATSTTITVPTSPFLNSPYIYALTNQSARNIDLSSVSATLTAGSGAKISMNNPYPVTYKAGTPYYSTYFNGTSDILTLTPGTFGSSDFTIEFWYYATVATGQVFFNNFRWYNGLTPGSMAINHDGTTGFYFNCYTGAGNVYDGAPGATITRSVPAANMWHHVAAVRQGATIYLGIDGVVTSATLTSNTALNLESRTSYWIGGWGDNQGGPGFWMSGEISNFRIVKGQALYTSNFTPSTIPLTKTTVGGTGAGAASSLTGTVNFLSLQGNTLVDASNDARVITTTTSKQVLVSPFTPNSYTSTPITNYGSAYFDGTGDYLYATSLPNFDTGDFTLELFWYPTTTGTYMTLYDTSAAGDGTATGRVLLDHQTGGYIRFYTDAGTTQLLISGAAAALPNQWNHIAVTRSGTVGRLFINGILVNTNNSMTTNFVPKANRPIIAANGYDASTSGFASYMADLRVIKGTALYTSSFVPQLISPLTTVTNTQLLTFQTNGSQNNSVFSDNSGLNNIVTRNGNVTNGSFSPYGDNFSNYFDGTTDVLTITSTGGILPNTATTFTIESWVYITALQPEFGSPRVPGMFGDINGVSNYFSFGPVNYAGVNYVGIYWYDGAGKGCYGTTTSFGLNTWVHIAASVSANTINLYVNGILQTLSGTTTLTGRNGQSGTYVIGGYHYATQVPYTGYVSNLRVINGSALYSSSFTPSTSALTANANTTLLTCQSNRFVDNSPLNFTLVKSADASVQKFSPFNTVIAPKYYSAKFNGSSDYLTVPSNSGFAFGTGDFTVECWLYVLGAGDNQFCFPVQSRDGTNVGFYLQYNRTNQNLTFASDSGTPLSVSSANASILDNTWYHVSVTRSGTTATLYLNGTSVSTTTSSENFTSQGILYISRRWVTDGALHYFNGYISNLRIIKGTAITPPAGGPTTPLTAVSNTVLLTCQDNTFIDKSTNNLAITAGTTTVKPLLVSPFSPTSIVTSYNPTVFGGSMYFDGTGDYLTAPYNLAYELASGNFTIEFWMYKITTGDQYIVHNRPTSASAGWAVMTFTNTIRFYYTGGTSINTTDTIALGQWYHIALVNTGGTMKIYFNGVQVLSSAIGTGTAATATNLFIGCDNGPTFAGFFNGYLSDMKITKGATLYTSNFYPGSAPATPATTIGTSVYTSSFLLNGSSSGITDKSRTVDLETVGDVKLVSNSPYNGTNYSINLPATSAYFALAQPALGNLFTIEMWVFPSAAQTNQYMYSGGSTSGPLIGYNSTTFSAAHQGGWSIAASTNPTVGAWNHIALVREGTGSNQFKMYLNGSLVGTGTDATTFGAQTGSSIGSSGNNSFTGYISNFRITNNQALYTGSFTPATAPLTTTAVGSTGAGAASSITGTVLMLTAQSNKFIDNSASPITLTVNGSPQVVTQNPFQVNTGLSYYFDGTGDYAIVSGTNPMMAFGAGDFTIELWTFFNTITGGALIVDFRPSTTNGAYPTIYVPNGTTTLVYLAASANQISSATGSITAGQWYHIMVVRTSGVTKMYLNGSQVGSNYTDANAYLSSTSRPVLGASGYDLTGNFNGYITDLRITKAARTVTVPTSPLRLS